MYYIVETNKSFSQTTLDLELAVKKNGFGVLHIHGLGTTLRSKGIPFIEDCNILEICNPRQAEKVLAIDMNLNMALPCRISVFTEKEKTKIGFIRPMHILAGLSKNEALLQIAKEIDEQLTRMVEEAK